MFFTVHISPRAVHIPYTVKTTGNYYMYIVYNEIHAHRVDVFNVKCVALGRLGLRHGNTGGRPAWFVD